MSGGATLAFIGEGIVGSRNGAFDEILWTATIKACSTLGAFEA
jgi:hypothetical protein